MALTIPHGVKPVIPPEFGITVEQVEKISSLMSAAEFLAAVPCDQFTTTERGRVALGALRNAVAAFGNKEGH